MNRRFLIFVLLSAGILLSFCSVAQPTYTFDIITVPEACSQGSLRLQIRGTRPKDTVTVEWKTGEKNIYSFSRIDAGIYPVSIKIIRHDDSLRFVFDTLIKVVVEKELCPLNIPAYFSPNDDQYNDFLMLGNIENYPEFELNVYNKWGQRVHHQEKTYVPWNGKWNGIDLPDGTYYYIIFYDKSRTWDVRKGDVTIIR